MNNSGDEIGISEIKSQFFLHYYGWKTGWSVSDVLKTNREDKKIWLENMESIYKEFMACWLFQEYDDAVQFLITFGADR